MISAEVLDARLRPRESPQTASRRARRFLWMILAALIATLVSAPAWASSSVAVRIAGTADQVLVLHRALTGQLRAQVRSKRISRGELTDAASRGGGSDLTVWVDLSDVQVTRLVFTRGGEVVAEREVQRNDASDDVHFEELALVVRSSVEALADPLPSEVPQDSPAETSDQAVPPVASSSIEPQRLASSALPRADEVRDRAPSPPQSERTPYRLDFEPTYAATTYAKDPNVLLGLGLGFEGVAQNVAANPGIRVSTDTTMAFEFTDSRPRVAHLRTLFTLGIERWLPARWGIGITGERVVLDSGDRRTESQSLVATLMGEFRLILGDRVDGVFGTLLDIQVGEPRVVRDDGVALERHRFRLSAYLGVAITAAGER